MKKLNTKRIIFSYILSIQLVFVIASVYGVSTTIVLQQGRSGKDALISSRGIEADRNFGNSAELVMMAWKDVNTDEEYVYRSLIDFDLSSIPSFATITNAKVSFYHNAVSDYSSGQNACCGANSYLQTITSPWDENTVTWNTRPSVSPANVVMFPSISSSAQNFTDVDVTAMIQDRKNNPSSNFGMMMRYSFDVGYYYDIALFASGDHPNSTLHPVLEVTFTTAGQSYLSSAPAVLDFASQPIGISSGTQSVNVFGSGLTPSSGSVTVTTTNSKFEVFDNVNGWGQSATLNYSSGQLNTTVNVRFIPQTANGESGSLNFSGAGISASSLPTTALTGSGTMCVSLSPVADAYVLSNQPNANFGSSAELNSLAWYDNNTNTTYVMRSLLNFDLSSIPANAIIGSAKLSLYYNPSSPAGNGQQYGFFNESLARRITSSWSENTVTWNNQPTNTEVNQAVLHTSTSPTQNYTDINVTELIKDIRSNPGSAGIMVKLTVEQAFQELLFASRQHPNAALRPRLDICYTPAAPVAQVPTLSEWGLIILAGSILVIGAIQFRNV
jgi:hypothetical protein